MKYTAIILAAGRGSRMKSEVPKQYLELGGHPLLYYTIRAFEESAVDDIILVTGAEEQDFCREMAGRYGFQKLSAIVPGGSERYLSVYQGLCAARQADVVLIHDGARPCVTREAIARTMESARDYGTGIAAVQTKDTISVVDSQHNLIETPDRSSLWVVQTPQAFEFRLFKAAYERILFGECEDVWVTVDGRKEKQKVTKLLTDDASVLYYGNPARPKIRFVEGDYRNIKVTTPEDLRIAELFLKIS